MDNEQVMYRKIKTNFEILVSVENNRFFPFYLFRPFWVFPSLPVFQVIHELFLKIISNTLIILF